MAVASGKIRSGNMPGNRLNSFQEELALSFWTNRQRALVARTPCRSAASGSPCGPPQPKVEARADVTMTFLVGYYGHASAPGNSQAVESAA